MKIYVLILMYSHKWKELMIGLFVRSFIESVNEGEEDDNNSECGLIFGMKY